MSAGLERAPGTLVADLRIARGLDYYTGTVYETQLVGAQEWGSVCSGGRYDSLASDGRTTYPGVGISIGVTRLPVDAGHPARPDREPVHPGGRPRGGHRRGVPEPRRRRSPRRCGPAGSPCEVAPSAAKFGKQIRYADRRGIPYVWFPGAADDGADQVKDIRSGEQVDADATSWECPAADLRPAVVTTSA